MKLCILSVICVFLVSFSYARPVDKSTAAKAAGGWLKTTPASTRQHIRTMRAIVDESGSQLCYAADLEEGGFIILSMDDAVEPVVAFSTEGAFVASPGNPLWDLLKQDLPRRYDHARRRIGRQEQSSKRGRRMTAGAEAISPSQQWSRLVAEPPTPAPYMDGEPDSTTSGGYLHIYDIRIWPLLGSKWGQERADGDYCYNYYTPTHYPAGCTAMALAQLIRYHEHPTDPVGTIGNQIMVDYLWNSHAEYLLGGDGEGGPYDWSQMPLIPDEGLTLTERQAIGALAFDAGIALSTLYTAEASSAYASGIPSALLWFFNYSQVVLAENTSGFTLPEVTGMINPNLDAGSPVLLAIRSTTGDSGHVIVADGYGYIQSTLYYHMNFGWDGQENAWYNLPDLTNNYYTQNVVDSVLYNIYPSGTGEIISGRVFDNQQRLLEGVTVRIVCDSGPLYSCVTDEKGIYALPHVSNGRHVLSASQEGYLDASLTVNVSSSTSEACGNIWGADLCLFDPSSLGAYGGGSGTELDPFLISSPLHLREMYLCPDDYGAHFRLTGDLDMTGLEFDRAPIGRCTGGSTTYYGTPFTGVFDGGDHTIRNLTVNTNGIGNCYLGLFGKIASGGEVHRLLLDNVSVRGGTESSYLGGLCGMDLGTIRHCGVTGTTLGGTGSTCCGGLVGYNEDTAIIEYSYAASEVSGMQQVGGLVGFHDTGATLRYCYVSGHVVSFDDPSYPENIGGLVGFNYGNISYCYSRATLAPETGSSSAYDGAICGVHYGGSATHCLFDRQTSGTLAAFGYDAASDSDVAGVTTADMKAQTTYTGRTWDFTTIWEMSQAASFFAGYPILQWQPEEVEPPAVIALRLELPAELIEERMGQFRCWADYADGSSENVSGKVSYMIDNEPLPIQSAPEGLQSPNPISDNAIYNYITSQATRIHEKPNGDYEMVIQNQTVTLSKNIVNLKDTVMEATGSDGCTLYTKPVTADTPLDISATFGGASTHGTVVVANRVVQFAGGNGTAANPYRIDTAEQLLNAGYYAFYATKHFRLMADIDLSDYTFSTAVLWPDSQSITGFQGTPFTGTFDGGGHRITGLQITAIDATDHYLGLFGFIGSGGRVFDLFVDSALIFCGSAEHIGLVAGRNEGTLERCKATGLILQDHLSRYAGLLCGSNAGLVKHCYTIGIAVTPQDVGGLVGSNTGTLHQCLALAPLDGDSSVGPLCGSTTGTVTECFWGSDFIDAAVGVAGTGLTADELHQSVSFLAAGWPFFGTGVPNPVWHTSYEGIACPKLWFERDIPGDLAGGYGVEMADFGLLAAAWASEAGQPAWNDACDLVNYGLSENVIDMGDLLFLLDNWLAGR